MKKIMSILLTLTVLMSSIGFTVFADDAILSGEEDSNLVFDLDFSRYESEGILTDTAGNAWISLVGDKSVTPNVSNYRSLSENGNASYITFAPGATSFDGDYGGRAIKAEIDERVLGQKELSFEYWMRSYDFDGRWDRIFAMGGDGDSGNRLDVELNASKTTFRMGLGTSNGAETKISSNQDICNGEWQHIVMSRKYDNGTLTATVFVNGEQIGTQTVENAPDPKIWETDKWETEQTYKVNLFIGGMPGGIGVFRGDMASFRIYDKVLTETEISENYESGKAMLTPLIVSDMDFSDYDGTVGSIKDNGIYGDGSTVYQSECVQKGTYINLKGEEVPFMDMVQQDSNRGRASIYNNIYGELEDYTVGAWVRIPDYTKRDWGTIIAHTDRNHYDTKIYGSEFIGATNTFKLQSKDIKSANSASIEPYQDVWAYFVFTKEWTKDENNSDVLTLKAYVNGREITDAAASGVVSDKSGYMGQTAFGLGSFYKGAHEGGTLIDFSSFTIYGKAFSDKEVAAEYAAMREDYTEYCEIDVNFDNFDSVNASTLSNRNTDTEARFTLLGSEIGKEAKEVKEIATVNGTKKVLSVDQSKANRLLVTADGISGQDEVSVEMWLKHKEGFGRIFCANEKKAQIDGGTYLDTWLEEADTNGRIYFIPFGNDNDDGNKGKVFVENFLNKWTHFVFNRKLEVNIDGSTQFIIEIYKNGALAATKTYVGELPVENKLTFTVMGSGYTGTAKSDLGSFVVRNKALSATEIAATYQAEANNYKEASVTVSAKKTENAIGSYSVNVQNTTSGNVPCTMLLAAYDSENDSLAGCAIGVVENGIDAGLSATKTLAIQNLDANKNYIFKLFIWKNAEGMTPHINAITLDD